jgi:hypothetical protein
MNSYKYSYIKAIRGIDTDAISNDEVMRKQVPSYLLQSSMLGAFITLLSLLWSLNNTAVSYVANYFSLGNAKFSNK